MISEGELAVRFPTIAWREPLAASVAAGIGGGRLASGFVCRICVAQIGLRGCDTERFYPTAAACAEHIEVAHPTR